MNDPHRTTNDAGLDIIRKFEGLRCHAYQDVAGIWTIGYGHIAGVTAGMAITTEEADRLLREDLHDAENGVSGALSHTGATGNQFSAMVSLCFNIGAANFQASSVLRYHLAGLPQKAADAFLLWGKAHVNGVLTTVPGLARRRAAERALYLQVDGANT